MTTKMKRKLLMKLTMQKKLQMNFVVKTVKLLDMNHSIVPS
uniref:Uncharacterized protein n=1 Tax=Arundo donax TaxID=35708 RepID=A0A0A8Z484_ARUDO